MLEKKSLYELHYAISMTDSLQKAAKELGLVSGGSALNLYLRCYRCNEYDLSYKFLKKRTYAQAEKIFTMRLYKQPLIDKKPPLNQRTVEIIHWYIRTTDSLQDAAALLGVSHPDLSKYLASHCCNGIDLSYRLFTTLDLDGAIKMFTWTSYRQPPKERKNEKSLDSAQDQDQDQQVVEAAAILLRLQGAKEDVQQSVPTKQILPGLEVREVEGDGDCLYHAIGFYLNKDAQTLRNSLADYLASHRREYEIMVGFLLADGQSFDDYVAGIRGREWGDVFEISILMPMLNRAILVVHPDGRIDHDNVIEQYGHNPIFIAYNGHTHYDAFIKKGDLTDEQILEQVKQLVKRPPEKESVGDDDLSLKSLDTCDQSLNGSQGLPLSYNTKKRNWSDIEDADNPALRLKATTAFSQLNLFQHTNENRRLCYGDSEECFSYDA